MLPSRRKVGVGKGDMAYTYLRNGICHKDSSALFFFSAYSSQVSDPFIPLNQPGQGQQQLLSS